VVRKIHLAKVFIEYSSTKNFVLTLFFVIDGIESSLVEMKTFARWIFSNHPISHFSGVVTGLQRLKEPTETEAGVVIVSLEQSLPDGQTEELKAEFNTV
jgi:hypothetical protein